MKLRDDYRQKIEAQLDELNVRLTALRAQAKRLGAEAKVAAQEDLVDAEKKLAALKIHLGKLRESSDDAFQELKGGVEKGWADLNAAAKRAMKRFG